MSNLDENMSQIINMSSLYEKYESNYKNDFNKLRHPFLIIVCMKYIELSNILIMCYIKYEIHDRNVNL